MEVKVVFKDPSYLEPPLSTSAPGRLGDGPLVPEQGRAWWRARAGGRGHQWR